MKREEYVAIVVVLCAALIGASVMLRDVSLGSITGAATTNMPPVWQANTAKFALATNTPLALNLDDLFRDPEGSALTFIATQTENLDVAQDGSALVITPEPGFAGERIVTVIASDGQQIATKRLKIEVGSGGASRPAERRTQAPAPVQNPAPAPEQDAAPALGAQQARETAPTPPGRAKRGIVEAAVEDALDSAQEVDAIIILKPQQEFGTLALRPRAEEIEQRKQLTRQARRAFREAQRAGFGAASADDLTVLREYDTVNAVAVRLTKRALERLKNDGSIAEIVLDRPFTAGLAESVPLVNANEAWSINAGGFNVTGRNETVCILDTGINASHAAFANKIVGGIDYVNEDGDPDDDSFNSHGTHVAGIAAGNASPVIGVAPDARIVPVKVCNNLNSCGASDILAGLDYCNNNSAAFNITAVSISIGDGGQYNSTTCPTAFESAVNLTAALGIIVSVSSGNNGFTGGVSYPACSPFVISVGSTTKADAISSFTNRGGDRLDILAPGSSIVSSTAGGTGTLSGTSMAAPHVSGTVALIQQNQRGNGKQPLTLQQMRSLLRATGKELSLWNRIDAYAALVQLNQNYSINLTEDSIANTTQSHIKIRFKNSTDMGGIANCAALRHNFAGIDSFACPQFNKSANISLANITGIAVSALRNGAPCPASICQNFSFANGIANFDVTEFSNYSSYNLTNLSGCATVNTSSILTQNIASNDTCIITNASNIVIFCSGFSIGFNANGSGTAAEFGVNVTRASNVTLADCIIADLNSTGGDANLMYDNANYTSVVNTTILGNGTTLVYFNGGHNNTLANSTLRTGGVADGPAIRETNITGNLLDNSSISFTGTGNLIAFNTFTSNASTIIQQSGNARIQYNNATIRTSVNSPRGIDTDPAGPFDITGNRIFIHTTGTAPNAFRFASSSGNVTNNTFLANGTGARAISIQASAAGIFAGNNFTAMGASSAAIEFLFAVVNTTRFTDTVISSEAAYIDINADTATSVINFTNTTFVMPNGSINIIGRAQLNGSKNVTLARLNVTLNRAYLNASNLTFLNQTGIVTLENTGLNDPKPQFDFEDDGTFSDCTSTADPFCTELGFDAGQFRFNTSHFTSFRAAEANGVNLTGCATINTSATLMQNVNSNNTCITVNANDIVFNCLGYNMTGNGSVVPAINLTRVRNVTVKDCIITNYSTSLLLDKVNSSKIVNISAVSANVSGVFGGFAALHVLNTTNSTFANLTIENINLGTVTIAEGSSNNTLINVIAIMNFSSSNFESSTGSRDNHFVNITGRARIATSITIAGENNTLRDSFGSSTTMSGVLISGTNNNVQNTLGISNTSIGVNFGTTANNGTNITGRSNFSVGIFITARNITIINGTGWSNSNIALQLYDAVQNARIIGGTYSSNTGRAIAIDIDAGGNFNNSIFNVTLSTNATWISSTDINGNNNTFTNTTFQTGNGSIALRNFTLPPAAPNINLAKLNVTSNRAFLNSTNLTFLNTTAVVTLNGITLTNPRPQFDFEDDGTFSDCTSTADPFCTEFSYAGGVFVFNSSHFTTFQSSETAAENLTGCATINESTALTQNVTGNGTCITIGASNITLNCNGNTIFYDSAGTGGDGITASARNNITVRDCVLRDINLSGAGGVGISLSNTENSTITNNTVTTNGTSQNYGISLSGSSFNNITLNNLTTNGSGTENHGITTGTSSDRNRIANNTISTNGGGGGNEGIEIGTASNFNNVTNNNIRTNSTGVTGTNYGVQTNSDDNDVSQNVILTAGPQGSNHGIRIEAGGGNTFTGNTITTTDNVTTNCGNHVILAASGPSIISHNTLVGTCFGGGVTFGIFLLSSSSNNVTNNLITVAGTSTMRGISVSSASSNNISHNTVNVLASNITNMGIDVSGSANTVFNNTVFVTGNESGIGINIEAQSDNNVSYNRVIANGTRHNIGIRVHNAVNTHRFFRNNVTVNGTASYGITISVSNNTIFNATLLDNPDQWINSTADSRANLTDTTFNMPNGSITVSGNFTFGTAETNLTKSKLNITSNRAFLNSTNLSFLNTTAVVTLNGLALSDPKPQFDFEDDGTFTDCTSTADPFCTEISYAGGVFVFNTSHFTSFQAAESGGATNLTGCAVINTTSFLSQNISSTGTCITFNANNIALNCAGFTITYGTGGGNDVTGVNITGVANATVENCTIRKTSALGLRTYGIGVFGSPGARIANNSVMTNGTGANDAIHIAETASESIPPGTVTLVNNPNNVNAPFCTNTTGSSACKVCFTVAGVNCAVLGQGGCTDGEGYKTDTLLQFNTTSVALGGSIQFLGGEHVLCHLNGNEIATIHTRNNCGTFRSANISSSAFVLGENNLTCSVSGSGSDEDNGFKLSSFSYTASGTILVQNTSNIVVQNNSVVADGGADTRGIFIDAPASNVSNNTVVTAGNATNYGIWVLSENNTVASNVVRTVAGNQSHGLLVAAKFTRVSGNNVSTSLSSFSHGILLDTTADNGTVANNTVHVTASGADALHVYFSTRNAFRNNTIVAATRAAVRLEESLDNVFNDTFIPASSVSLFIVEPLGTLNFSQTINITNLTNLSQVIGIGTNDTFINATDNRGQQFNRSGLLSFNSFVAEDARAVVDLNDTNGFEACSSPRCTGLSYNRSTGIARYSVSSFTSYAVRSTFTCTTLDLDTFQNETNASFILEGNVTGTATCFTITSENISLNCNGSFIFYDSSGVGGHGIDIQNARNIVVENCTIVDINAGGSAGHGIFLSNANNSRIANTTIQTNGTNFNNAIHARNSHGNLFVNNTFLTRGTSNINYGVFTQASSNNVLREVFVRTFGSGSNFGVYFNSSSNNNTLFNSTIRTGGVTTANRGVQADFSNNNNISNNNIITNGTANTIGIGFTAGNFSRIEYNTVVTNSNQTGSSSVIRLDSSNIGSQIIGNNLSAFGADPFDRGIEGGAFDGLALENNIIIADGGMNVGASDCNYTRNVVFANATAGSIFGLVGGPRCFIAHNNITMNSNGSGAVGISLTQTNATIANNTIAVNSTNAMGLRLFDTSVTNTSRGAFVENNTIRAQGDLSYALDLLRANFTVFRNNLLNDSTGWMNTSNINGTNFTNTTFAMPNGSIQYLGQFTVNGTHDVGRTRLNVSFNRAFVNSSNLTFFNTSARIMLFNISLDDPAPIRDVQDRGVFRACPFSICSEDSYANGIFIFNVTQFTTYAAGEGLNISKSDSPDPVLTGGFLSYTIVVSVFSGNASNVTLTEQYPPQSAFVSAQPTPLAGTNNTFVLGNLTLGDTIELNITVLTLLAANNTVINNTVNVSFNNQTGALRTLNVTEGTTVLTVQCPQTLTTTNTLLQNLSSNGSCITIGADNIVFDCDGLHLLGNGSGTGVSAASRANITIRDCIIENFETGIGLTTTVRSAFINNTIISTNVTQASLNVTLPSTARFDRNDSSNIFDNVILQSNLTISGIIGSIDQVRVSLQINHTFDSDIEINLTSPDGTKVALSSFEGSGGDNFGNDCISDANRTVFDQFASTAISSGSAPFVGTFSPDGNLSAFDDKAGAAVNGVWVLSVEDTAGGDVGNLSCWSVLLNISGSETVAVRGIRLQAASNNNTFSNNTATGNLTAALDFGTSQNNSAENTVLGTANMWLVVDSSSPNNTFRNTTFDQPNGSIGILPTVIAPAVNLSLARLNITFNNAFLNSTAHGFLNTTGVITLRNIVFGNPTPIFDFEDDGMFGVCTGAADPFCTEFSYGGGVFAYNVSHFTSYSSAEQGGVEIVLVKSDFPDPVNASAQLNYTVVVNVTTGNASNITLTDIYPPQVIFQTAQPSPLAGTNNTFIVGNLTNGTAVTVNITVLVLNVSNGTVINNTANITFQNQTSGLFNQSVTESTTVLAPIAAQTLFNLSNISVIKADSPDPVNASANLTYIINVTSTGSGIAYNVTVNDTYPAQVIFLSSQPLPVSGTNNTFILGNLTPNTSILVNVTVLTLNVSNGTIINNSVNVTFQNETSALLSRTDTENTTVANVTLVPQFNLSNITVTKTDTPDSVNTSANLTYVINVTSNGNGTAYNVTVNDTYPAQVIFLSSQPTAASGTNNTFILGNLTAGASILVNITVLVQNISNNTVINNSANVTFQNETSATLSRTATASTTVTNLTFAAPAAPAGQGGGSGGGGNGGGGGVNYNLNQPQPEAPACIESWACEDWQPCVNGIRVRTCVDQNNCGTIFLKPGTGIICETPAAEQVQSPAAPEPEPLELPVLQVPQTEPEPETFATRLCAVLPTAINGALLVLAVLVILYWVRARKGNGRAVRIAADVASVIILAALIIEYVLCKQFLPAQYVAFVVLVLAIIAEHVTAVVRARGSATQAAAMTAPPAEPEDALQPAPVPAMPARIAVPVLKQAAEAPPTPISPPARQERAMPLPAPAPKKQFLPPPKAIQPEKTLKAQKLALHEDAAPELKEVFSTLQGSGDALEQFNKRLAQIEKTLSKHAKKRKKR